MKRSTLMLALLGVGIVGAVLLSLLFMRDEDDVTVGDPSSPGVVRAGSMETAPRRKGASEASSASKTPSMPSDDGPRPIEVSHVGSQVGVSGRVLRAGDGQPIPGARVELLEGVDLSDFARLGLSQVMRTLLGPRVVFRETTTDEAGRFVFRGVLPGAYSLRARAKRFARHISNAFTVATDLAVPQVELKLQTAARCAGRVVDRRGRGVSGAVVQFIDMGRGGGTLPLSYRIVTNGGGTFVFEDIESGRFKVLLTAEGYGITDGGVVEVSRATGSEPPRDFVLQDEAFLAGRVFDVATGEGLEDALVHVLVRRGPREIIGYAEAPSGEDGIYEVRGLPAEFDLLVDATRSGYTRRKQEKEGRGVFSGIHLEVSRRSGERDLLDIPMMGGASVSGRVIDARSGAPVRGATVHLVSPNGRGAPAKVGPVLSDDMGRFEVRGAPAGVFVLAVSHSDYVPTLHGLGRKGLAGFFRAPAETERLAGQAFLAPGEVRDGLEIPLTPGMRLRGRVVDVEGAPVAGATVSVETDDRGSTSAISLLGANNRVVSDAEGRFVLSSLPRAKTATVLATHPGYPSYASRVLDLRDGVIDAPLTLRLGAACRLTGRAFGADGGPAGEKLVEFLPRMPVPLRLRTRRKRGMQGADRRTRTDADGRFRLDDLAAGRYATRVDGRWAQRVELEPGETKEIELRPAREAVIEGVTVDDDGNPLSLVTVAARRQAPVGAPELPEGDSGNRRGSSGRDGRFRLVVPAGSTYTLSAWRWEYGEGGGKGRKGWVSLDPPLEVTAGTSGVRVVLVRR